MWGKKVFSMLHSEGREVVPLNVSRPNSYLSLSKYQDQIKKEIIDKASDANIIWIAIPPGQQEIAVKCALELSKNVIVEKPWLADAEVTKSLIKLAQKNGCQIRVNFQLCYLSLLPVLQLKYKNKENVIFSGSFSISRDNRLSVEAMYNLGSHLVAIHDYMFPFSEIGNLTCNYNTEDIRFFSLESADEIDVVDIGNNEEPLLQVFIEEFERSLRGEDQPKLGLEFALKVTAYLKSIINM